jgi:TetR/AcrR family transcriptional regulator
MSLFGMINWSYLWFRPEGPMTRAAYADLVTQITVDGISSLGATAASRSRPFAR